MKKTLLISLLLCSSAFLQAQKFQGQELTVKTNSSVSTGTFFEESQTKQTQPSTEKSTICTDQVRYGDKGTAQAGGDIGGDFWGAFQVFPYFTGSITGATFNGNSLTGSLNASDSFALVVYNIYYDGSFETYLPTGSPLGGAYLTSIGGTTQDYSVTFATPITVSNIDGFAVALISQGSGDSVNVNMSPDFSGDGGHFSFVTGGTSIYSLYLGGYDSDLMIYPTISFMQPTVGLTASSNSICEGTTVNFTNTPSVTPPVWYDVVYGMASFNPIVMYNTSIQNNELWSYDFGDGSALVYSNTQSGSNHMYPTLGLYDAELALNYQGYTNDCKAVSIETIAVTGPPTGYFLWESTGLSVEFTEMTVGATTFSWNFGDAGSSGAPNPIHNYGASGTYTVELTATNACGSELFFINIEISDTTNSGNLNTNEQGAIEKLSFYPNPSKGKFFVNTTENGIDMTIYDLVGKLVAEKHLLAGENVIDLSNEAKGVYMANFKDEFGNVRSERIVID